MNSYLEIENIPETDNCLKLKVSGSSLGFSGVAECYVNESKFKSFVEQLKGFPRSINDSIVFSSGKRDDLSYFDLNLSCKDSTGNVLVKINILHIDSSFNSQTVTQSVSFQLTVEAAEIDRFQPTLETVSVQESVGEMARLNAKI